MKKPIWITTEIINTPDLDFISQGILSQIESLSKLEKGCYISNNAIADYFGISLSNAKRRIQELKSLGYINIKLTTNEKNVTTRIITMTDKLYQGVGSKRAGGRVKTDQRVGSKRATINTSLSKDREMYKEKLGNQTPSIKGSVSNKQKIKPKFQGIDGNIILSLEDKVGSKATLIYANMNDDSDIPTKDEFRYLVRTMTKEQLVELYGNNKI